MASFESIARHLPDDLLEAENMIIQSFLKLYHECSLSGDKINSIDKFIDILSLHQVFTEEFEIELEYPVFTKNKKENVSLITNFFRNRARFVEKRVQELTQERSLNDRKSIYKNLVTHKFTFHLKEEEVEKLRQLIDELIGIVELIRSDDNVITHIDRLFRRLKNLKGQLNIKAPSLDEFWGLIGDAGISVGKFSRDAKPIVERIRDILNMVWQIQARAESLGAQTPKMMLNFQEISKPAKEAETLPEAEDAEETDEEEDEEPEFEIVPNPLS